MAETILIRGATDTDPDIIYTSSLLTEPTAVIYCSVAAEAYVYRFNVRGNYHIALPETTDFLKADLHGDPTADLAQAEGD
jgi:hypothetical protein